MNSNISAYIGSRIRLLRQEQNISNKKMASLLGKSYSTISKYETGAIAIDINTLYQIARILHVSLSELTSIPEEENHSVHQPRTPFGDEQILYLYYHDGSNKNISKAYLRIYRSSFKNETEVYCYLDNPPFLSRDIAGFIYHGTMYSYDFITYIFLTNPANAVDRLNIIFLNPLHQSQSTWGILSSILHNPIAPYVTKVLISKSLLSNQDITSMNLQFTKEELKWMKKESIIYIRNEK